MFSDDYSQRRWLVSSGFVAEIESVSLTCLLNADGRDGVLERRGVGAMEKMTLHCLSLAFFLDPESSESLHREPRVMCALQVDVEVKSVLLICL